MTKQEVLDLIDGHKNKLIDPVEMLGWTWLRVFICQMPKADFECHMQRAAVICGQ